MTKHKGQQALFDLLRKDRPQTPAAAKPVPVIRRTPTSAPAPAPVAAPRPVEAPRPAAARVAPRPYSVGASEPFLMRQVTIPVSWLIIGVIAVACLLVIAFAVGQWYAPERLPNMPKGKSFAEIQTDGPKPGLVAQGPAQPAAPSGVRPASQPPGRPSVTTERPSPPAPAAPRLTVAERPAAPAAVRPGSAERPITTETPAPSGPQWRVRIAQLAVSQPDAIDKMRGFLLQKDVETELETSRGFYVLYSRERLTDKKKADELAARINKQLEAFEKATRIPTSKTAYATQVTKE
ncbi:MAG: hypothetical protein NTY65_13395 [Planctomycetota bacterium]|nr:hypothetical protein [Planctomycetota bacterium]